MAKKIILWLFIVIAVLVVTLLIALNPLLSWSTTKAFNKFAPQMTGTPSSVESVDFSVYQGRIAINDLQVGNPTGFRGDNAISLGEMVLQVNPSSLLTDTIHIEEISINSPQITLEQQGRKNNLIELKKQISENTGAKDKAKDAPAKEKKPKGEGKQYIVNKVQLLDAHITLTLGELTQQIVIPDIVLENVAPEGISAGELAGIILEQTLVQISSESAGTLGNLGTQINENLTNQLKELEKQGQGTLETIREEGRNQTESLLNNLLGK